MCIAKKLTEMTQSPRKRHQQLNNNKNLKHNNKCFVCSSLLVLLFFSVALILCQPMAVTAQPYRERFENPKCTDSQTGRELYIGEAYTRVGQCVRVQCLGDLKLWEDRCQVPKLLPGNCTRMPAANEYLNYPKCCPLYECKRYETTAHTETEETNIFNHYGMLQMNHITKRFLVQENPGRESGGAKAQFVI